LKSKKLKAKHKGRRALQNIPVEKIQTPSSDVHENEILRSLDLDETRQMVFSFMRHPPDLSPILSESIISDNYAENPYKNVNNFQLIIKNPLDVGIYRRKKRRPIDSDSVLEKDCMRPKRSYYKKEKSDNKQILDFI
jgi:hypothetical protein